MEFFLLLLYVYQGTIDDYAPKHIGVALNLISFEYLSPISLDLFDQVPGYYALISTIILLTNIDVYALPIFPILFVPYLLVSFLLFYVLSDKNIPLSSAILLFTMSAPLTGTHKIFIWPHGFGDILYFSLICILYKYFISNMSRTSKYSKLGYSVFITIIICTVSFMSYNNTFYTIFLLIFLFIGLLIVHKYFQRDVHRAPLTVLYPFFILVAIVLGLHKFAFEKFIPLMDGNSISISIKETFAKFLQTRSFFSVETESAISTFFIQTPQALTYIQVLKYATYLIMITLASYALLNRLMRKRYINEISDEYLLLVFGMTGVVGLYFVTRLSIGQFAITEIFIVFILSLITLSKLDSQTITKFIYLAVAGLICMNFASMGIATSNNTIQKDDFNYLYQSSEWYYSHCDGNHIYIPDQLTFGWYFLTFSNHFPKAHQNTEPRYLSEDDIVDLYLGTLKPDEKMAVINYRTNYNAIGTWRYMLPFSHRRDTIENNNGINTIYTYNDDLVIVRI